MEVSIKQEIPEPIQLLQVYNNIIPTVTTSSTHKVTAVTNSDAGYANNTDYVMDDDDDVLYAGEDGGSRKKQKLEVVLPLGFLDPLSPEERYAVQTTTPGPPPDVVSTALVIRGNEAILSKNNAIVSTSLELESCKQFWKAADFDDASVEDLDSTLPHGAMDHVRVHPRFLHSNATSHKWALGAFAELLDNALDEMYNGATCVQVDMLDNKKDPRNKMLLVQDNGGGMAPHKMRQCMSLGYSAKSKMANTIGQYGNGFKTSTMRLGADVIVFSRCLGKGGLSPTQSIGMLSYTFLRKTGKEDIVVPMIDYEKRGFDWRMLVRSSPVDWKRNLDTIVQWSPYSSEEDLLQQFNFIHDQGTRIIIYNLWEDDQEQLELDFESDPHDIQMRGVNRDEKNIEMAREYPNSRHFLTYRHSLKSYAAILYLRLPSKFRIIIRGKEVKHHNIVNDMMNIQEHVYRPKTIDGIRTDEEMSAAVKIGFVKDAKSHIDVQGFNVYHKNRLIKPFWRVWNAAGSDGRGVIGVLEANFVEPAHDKQGFERTTVLHRLEQRLIKMQKDYWSTNCHEIGYAKRRNKKNIVSPERVCSPTEDISHAHSASKGINIKDGPNMKSTVGRSLADDAKFDEMGAVNPKTPAKSQNKTYSTSEGSNHIIGGSCVQESVSGNGNVDPDSKTEMVANLINENQELKQRLESTEGMLVNELLSDLKHEKDRAKSLEKEVQSAKQKIQVLDNEQITLINIFSEERTRRDQEEANLRKRLKDASDTIEELRNMVKMLENRLVISCKIDN